MTEILYTENGPCAYHSLTLIHGTATAHAAIHVSPRIAEMGHGRGGGGGYGPHWVSTMHIPTIKHLYEPCSIFLIELVFTHKTNFLGMIICMYVHTYIHISNNEHCTCAAKKGS